MPYLVKTLKNLLLQNYKAYDLETWHEASMTKTLQMLHLGLTLTYFTIFCKGPGLIRGIFGLRFSEKSTIPCFVWLVLSS